MADDTTSVPVAPDAVRVFRGFRRQDIRQEEFVAKLGSVFIPATVQIQSRVGLTAYMPSVMPVDHHPDAPDEIALVFYEYPDAYHEAKGTVGGRAYSDLHGLVFDLDRSLSGFPSKFAGRVEAGGRYHLFDQHVDWQSGPVNVFVGVPADDEPRRFLDSVAGWLREVQHGGGPDGAIASTADDYVVYWEHWPTERAADASAVPRLAASVETVYCKRIPAYRLDHGLWEPYEGLVLTGGETFNFQFRRTRGS